MSLLFKEEDEYSDGFDGEDFQEAAEVIYDPLADQERRLEEKEDAEKAALGIADPTAVSLNRSEFRGAYIDAETGKRFRPGVPTEVGKIHAQRLLALRGGRLFAAV
jgi:hypothetical protein